MNCKKFSSAMLAFSSLIPLVADTALICDQTQDSVQSGELLPAGDREKALARFIAALIEKDPGVKLQMLLKVIEADPENASAPLKAFSTVAFQLPANKIPMGELNALWTRFPQNFVIARHAAMLNIRCNVPYANYSKMLEPLFELTPARVIALPEIAPRSFGTMLKIALNHALREQNWSFIEKQYARWFGKTEGWEPSPAWRDRLAPLFAPILFNAEVQAEIAGNKALYEQMKSARLRMEQQMGASIKRFRTIADFSDVIDYELKMHHKARAMELAREAQKKWNQEALTLYFVTSILTGTPEDFEKAAALIQQKNPRFDTSVSRFKMYLNAKLFADAEQALKSVPLKQQNAEYLELLLKSGRWTELKNKLEQQLNSGSANPSTALMLLTSAEHLKSIPCFERARKILMPLMKTPAVANAIGYVGAVLDRDLEQGRILLQFALEKEPENAAYLDSAAWIAYKQKRYKEAEKLIRKSLRRSRIQDGMSVLLEHAGDIATAQGKPGHHYYELALKYAQFDTEFDSAALKKRMR